MLTDTVTHSPEETEAVGARLAKMMEAGSLPTFVALYGDLGVGKTAFVLSSPLAHICACE